MLNDLWRTSGKSAIGVALLTTCVLGCAPARTPSSSGLASAPAAVPEVRKTVTVGQLNTLKAFAPWDFSDTSGGGAALVEVHATGLVSMDNQGNRLGRLAERMPSLDEGSVVILPDGRMQVTWTLRQGITWQDGAPFSSDDLLFSWEILRTPEIPVSGSQTNVARNVDSVHAVDPRTFVITWKRPYYRALDMGMRNYWVFPKHLLAEAFQGDKQAFMAQPYFTTEYVHLGPFRLVDFQAGVQQVFRRVDSYFLGRPKVETIVIKNVRDPNALFANLKAGAVDVVGERTLSGDLFLQLREEWTQTGEGTVVDRQYNWRYLQVQHGQQWARPAELAQDVRLRRGLLRALDREAIRQFIYPGFEDTGADSFMLKADSRAPIVGQPFAAYGFDVNRGLAELAEAGWQRATDGRLLGRDGRQVQIEIRGSTTDMQGVALVADFWRRIGIDTSEVTVAGPTSDDPEYRSTFPGVESTARSSSEDIFPNFDGRLHSLPENRWIGGNRMHYANPALDQLVDHVYSTIDHQESGRILKEVGDIFAADVPVLPLHFVMEFAAARKGVRALIDEFASGVGSSSSPGLSARGAYMWDRD
jgi:peptide/nickel transport system substrate-binding protein